MNGAFCLVGCLNWLFDLFKVCGVGELVRSFDLGVGVLLDDRLPGSVRSVDLWGW